MPTPDVMLAGLTVRPVVELASVLERQPDAAPPARDHREARVGVRADARCATDMIDNLSEAIGKFFALVEGRKESAGLGCDHAA